MAFLIWAFISPTSTRCAAPSTNSLCYSISSRKSRAAKSTKCRAMRDSRFVGCRGSAPGMNCTYNLDVPSGARVMAIAETPEIQREFCNLLKRHIEPGGGYITAGGIDIMSLRAQTFREEVVGAGPAEHGRHDYPPSTSTCTPRTPAAREIWKPCSVVGLESTVMTLDEGTRYAPGHHRLAAHHQ